MIFDFYRKKLIRMRSLIPRVIPKSSFENELPIEQDKPFNAFLVKEI